MDAREEYGLEANPRPRRADVSIIIKALNEEEYISRSIESALKALTGISGEVILADSVSTDRTVEIARQGAIGSGSSSSPTPRKGAAV